jgi:prepilin-type N-terminal cleavage/methylation domain-containing protein
MTRRRGFTLVELLTVIVCLTVLLGISAALIHALVRVDRSSRTRLADANGLGRLAREFKRDVHGATAIELSEDKTSARLRLPERNVEYRVEGTDLVVVREAPNSKRHRDTIHLANLGTPRFGQEESQGRMLVRLAFEPGPVRPGLEKVPPMRIEATLGRDHRHERKEAMP